MNSTAFFFTTPLFYWDTILVISLAVVCMTAISAWLILNRYGYRYPLLGWAIFLLLLLFGCERAAHEETVYRNAWEETLLGITRSFVSTTELLGHAAITRDTTMEDPVYRRIRSLHAAWCRDNPMVAYVFTLRLRENESEKVDWIVSCESDLNGDGKIEGDEEVGEDLYQPYNEWFPIYGKGFAGLVELDDHVFSPEYGGRFVTAVAPLRDADGSIEAILGVDFRADRWYRVLGQIRSASTQFLAIILFLFLGAFWFIAFLRQSVRRMTLVNAELMAAKRAADAAAKAKSDFLANMSHEIRTPMNALLGFTDILTQRLSQICSPKEREESEGILEIIRKSSRDLLTIINDILDFSRIEANLLQVESVPVSIKQVIEDVWQMESAGVISKHLDFSVKYKEPIPPFILSDPVRLRQILVNLIGNAVKFTDSGSVTVHCETLSPPSVAARSRFGRAAEEDSSILPDATSPYPVSTILRIDVIDTGIGIPPGRLKHLFQPFTQGDMSTTRPFGGTGLGLSIAKRLANLLDGDISAISTPNEGSTFTLQLHVYLPSEEESPAAPELPKTVAGHGAPPSTEAAEPTPGAVPETSGGDAKSAVPISRSQPLKHARILLIEDMPVNQIVISTQLRDAGAAVEIVGNGELGIEKINRDIDDGLYFDIVLMDMQMPVMDGYEATACLRSQGYQRPIIAITAHALTGDRERTIEAGCNDYIAKPVDRQVLIDTIKKYLKK